MLTKQILHPTSGYVVPGEMMALVGPSGAGACCSPYVLLVLYAGVFLTCQQEVQLSQNEHMRQDSCAGKSTLLDILSQRKGGKVSGQVNTLGAPSPMHQLSTAASSLLARPLVHPIY